MKSVRDLMVALAAGVWFVLGGILLALVFMSVPEAPCQSPHVITHYLGSTFCEPK